MINPILRCTYFSGQNHNEDKNTTSLGNFKQNYKIIKPTSAGGSKASPPN